MTTSSSDAPATRSVPVETQEAAVEQGATETLEANDDREAFECEWSRFQRVYERRRDHFFRESQQQAKTTSRLFIIARKEEPWNCFGLTTRIAYCRRAWEVSALHFSELHHACAAGDRTRANAILHSITPEDSPSQGCTLSRDSCGRVPLHHAVVCEQRRVIRMLLRQEDSRLQLHTKDSRDATPVQYVLEKIHRIASKFGGQPVRQAKSLRGNNPRYHRLWRLADRMLTKMNASFTMELQALDFKARGDAWDAVRAGDLERLKQIRTLHGDFGDWRLDELGTTLLHEACSGTACHLDVVLYLVSEGRVDRRAVDQAGATALNYAAMRGWLEACVLLLDIDDDQLDWSVDEFLMLKDARGRTPLHAALHFVGRSRRADEDPWADVAAESLATARYLVQRCADALHIVDLNGFTPLHYAICAGDHGLVQLMVDLGAAVLRDDAPTARQASSDFGPKAAWAPCGQIFSRNRKRRRHKATAGQEACAIVSAAHEASSEKTTRPEESSKACERLRKVKAGQVEHPGVALPMETLWFWVHSKPQQLGDSHSSTGTNCGDADDSRESPQPGDLQRYGCRRFGALCPSCIHVPGEEDGKFSPPEHHLRVAISPLLLAIRCCRRAPTTGPSRLAIVETLITAGASPDQAALDESLHTPQSLESLQLLLAHSTSGVTLELILRHLCSGFEPSCDGKDNNECALLLLLEELHRDELVEVLPSLFYHRYFRAIDHVLTRKSRDDAVLAATLSGIIHPTQANQGSKSRVVRQLTIDHLDCLGGWIRLWPAHARDLANIAIASVSDILKATSVLTATARRTVDVAISSALELLSIHASDELHESATEWTLRAFERGFVMTVQRLWRVIISTHSRATGFVKSVRWPLRSADAQLSKTLLDLLPSLLEAVVDHEHCGYVDPKMTDDHEVILMQCLAIACSYATTENALRRLVTCINQAKCDDQAVDRLLSQRVNGSILVDHLVKNDRVAFVEMLWTELTISDGARGRLWIALVKARLCFCHIQSTNEERWSRLLFESFPVFVDEDVMKDVVLKTLVRVSQPCHSTTQQLLRWLGGPQEVVDQTTAVHWAETSLFFRACARYNAIAVARQCIETWQTPDAKSTWSRLVTQRDDTDGHSAIDVCELLGHHELARFYRGLAVKTDSPTAMRRHGLFRTAMSLPLRSTGTSPRVLTKIDCTAVWEGDWKTAVALNDVRMLQTFFLHDLPLHPPSPDTPTEDAASAVAILMETAIHYGSEDALQWLLLNFSSTMSQLSIDTTTTLLHRAASHTSTLYARLTLRLLNQPGFSPGRLCGDGTDVTLLHRVACFADSELAIQAFKSLFQLDNCDVNVRDGFGSTPVMYAMACGRLETVCWLLSHCATTRLEAEYEGQSLFYYSLHLLPSFAWRCVIQQLLTAKRQAAFLHCDADGCACKGFEGVVNDADQHEKSCSFCSHSVETHTRVPYPPWFRDQYETYVLQESHEEAKEDDEDDEDEEAAVVRRQRAQMELPLADEPTLEKDRGRLRIPSLLRVTQLRFHALCTTYDLSIPIVEDSAVMFNDEDDEEEATSTADSGTNLADTDAASSQHLVHARELSSMLSPVVVEAPVSRFRRGDDAGMVLVHGPCCRLNLHDAPTTAAQRWIVLAKWFRLSNRQHAERIFVLRDRVSTLRAALARWNASIVTKSVPDPAASTSTSWVATLHEQPEHTSNPCPVAQEPKLVEREENIPAKRSTTSMNLSDVVVDMIGPPRGTTSNANANRCVSILQLFVHHWRYARVYQSFRQWKRLMVNAQVANHELETLVDTWSACDRREKLQGLKAKQHALEMEIRMQGLLLNDNEGL